MFQKFAKTTVLAYTNDTSKGFGYSKTASIDKIASYYKEQPLGTIDVKAKLETVADTYKISKNPDDYVFVSVRALTANVPNENHDCFMEEELLRFDQKHGCKVYATFNLKPHHVNHRSSDPTQARGCIIDVHYNTKNAEHFPELLIAVDKTKDKKLAEGIASGELNAFSMGCSAGHTLCSICGNKASVPSEFCSHISLYKGKEVEGKIAFEDCREVGFEEESSVDDPADKLALTQEVILASKGDNKSDMAMETEFLAVNTKLNGLSDNVKRVIEYFNKKEASKKEAATNEEVIEMFLKDSFPKDKLPEWGTTNLKIKKIGNTWGLVNYSTVMLYRDSGEVYSNTTKYSSSTSAIQSKIKSIASDLGVTLKEVKEEDMPVKNASKIAGFDAEEIAETFINGNISDARKAIGNSIAKFNAVLELLEEWGQDTSSFRRLMSRDASKTADADKIEKLDALQKEIRQLLDTKTDEDYQKAKELIKEKDKLMSEVYEIKTAEGEELEEDASITKPYGAETPEDQNNEQTKEEEENQDDLEEYKKKKEDETNKPISSEELGVVTTMANKKKKADKRKADEEQYLSDEDIAKRYDDFEIVSLEMKPSKSSGYIEISFPHGEDVVDNFIIYDNGKIAFDNWYPSEIGRSLTNYINKNKDTAKILANKKIKSNGGTMSVNTPVTKEANPYLALKKKAVDNAAKDYWEKLQPGYGKDMTKDIKKKKLQALLEKKRAEKAESKSAASDKLWKDVNKGTGNAPALWKTKGKGNPPKEFKNAASDKLWKDVNKGTGNAPAAWKSVTGKGNPPKEFKFAKLYQDIQAFPAGNMLVIAKAMRPIYVISNVSANAENKTASETTKLNPVAILRAIASKGLKVAMDEYKAKKLQALYPTVRKPSIVDDPISDGMVRVKPTDSVEKGGDDDLSSVDRSKLKETNLSNDGKNDIKLAIRKKADDAQELHDLLGMIEEEQKKGTSDLEIFRLWKEKYPDNAPLGITIASKKSSISETTTSDLVNFSKTKPEATKPITSNGGSDLAGVKRDTARADELYSGGKDDLDADELKKKVVTVKADRKIANEMTPEAQDFVSKKIEKLIGEGKSQDQAAAIAYSMAREEGYEVPEKSASIRPRILIDKKAIKAEIEAEVKKAAAIEVASYKTAFRQRFLRALKLANLRATKNLVDNPLKASMADVLFTPTREYTGMDMEMANQLTEESFAKGSLDYINSIVAEAEKFIEMPEDSFLAIEDDTKKLNLVIPVADIESEVPGDFEADEPMYAEEEESPMEAKAARFANANPIFKPSAVASTKWSHLKGVFTDWN